MPLHQKEEGPLVFRGTSLDLPYVCGRRIQKRRASGPIDSFADHDGFNCLAENLPIQQEARVVGIPGIQLPTHVDGHVIAPMHHRPTGYTGTDIQPPEVGRPITLNAFGKLRTRPDETHLAAHHVPQLRYFIQTGSPKNPTQAGDAQIRVRTKSTAVRIANIRRIAHHRSEFNDAKFSTSPTNTLLHEQYRPSGADFDGHSNQPKQRRKYNQRRDGHREIKEALPGTA